MIFFIFFYFIENKKFETKCDICLHSNHIIFKCPLKFRTYDIFNKNKHYLYDNKERRKLGRDYYLGKKTGKKYDFQIGPSELLKDKNFVDSWENSC